MKNIFKNSLILCGLLLAASLSFAQTIVPSTTLSAAITSTSSQANTFRLTSTTGISAGATVLFIDGEADFVNAVTSTTVTVTRGQPSSRVTTHLNGALVWFGPPNYFQTPQPAGYPAGSCTRSGSVLPYIDINNNAISDCVGGVWVSGGGSTSTYNSYFRVTLPPCGGAGYSTCGTNTAIAAATSMYCSEIDVQGSKYTTGLAPLNGATVGTDKHLVVLYDGTGNLVANSAVAGATTSGANSYQTYAFTTPYFVVGPAKYYACLQSNGTTDTVQMLAVNKDDTFTTKAVTGQTFGTVPATITVPTTFTTVVGPHWALY
jgi:hypothetical protein